MSKPLEKRVSTPLSENIQIGPFSLPGVMWPVSVTRSQVWMGSRCVKFGVIALTLASHWKFTMAPRGKELWGSAKKIVALHKDGLGFKKIAKTLKLSYSTVAKTIQQFNRTGSTRNRPRHGQPKNLSARAQRHIQRLSLGNRRMSAASIAAEVEGVGGRPVSVQTLRRTLHQIGCMAVIP